MVNVMTRTRPPLSIGYAVRVARERAGLNRAELANDVGMNPSYISQLEAGRKDRASWDILLAICDATGMAPLEFFQLAGLIRLSDDGLSLLPPVPRDRATALGAIIQLARDLPREEIGRLARMIGAYTSPRPLEETQHDQGVEQHPEHHPGERAENHEP